MKKEYYLIIAFMMVFSGCTRIANIYDHQGHLKFLLKDYQSAINNYTNALKLDDKNAEAYFSRGLSNFYLKSYSKAVDDFSKASKINPKDALAYYYRGNSKFNLLDYRGAIGDYSIAIKIEPTIEEFYFSRIDTKDKLNDIKGKIDDYSEIITLNTRNENAYKLRGFSKLSLQDNAGAISDFTKFIEISPSNLWSLTEDLRLQWTDLFWVIDYIGENPQKYLLHIIKGIMFIFYKGEEHNFTKAIEIDSLNPVAYYLRGKEGRNRASFTSVGTKLSQVAYYLREEEGRNRDIQRSIDDFNKVIELTPDEAEANAFRANAYAFRAKLDTHAFDDYKKALEIDPKNIFALDGIIVTEQYRRLSNDEQEAFMSNLTGFKNECNRVLSGSRLKKHIGAIYDYSNNSALNPASLTIGEKRILLQYHNETVSDINGKIEANPNDNSNYPLRGDLRTVLQDYTGAIEDYTKALQLDPRDTMTYYNRASVKLIQLDYHGAIDDISVIAQIYPKDTTAYYSRAFVKLLLNDNKGAIDDITKVIQINPENAEAYYKRSLLEIKIGQKENGCNDLSKAGELGYAKAYDLIKVFCQ